MATSSLGRLTLDLIMKIGSFEEGMNKAERKTKDATNKMSSAMQGFKDQVSDALGGTYIGGLVDNFNNKIGSMRGGVLVAGAALTGMAVGGVALAAGALTKMAIDTAKADAQLVVLANRANTSVQSFQVLEYASAQLGMTQDQLGAALADTQEKLGEFTASESGGAGDFFEALKNNTKMTEDQIRSFAKTLSGKDGIEAIQAINTELDKLDVTKQERRFVFESLASDLGNLAPLFAENGRLLTQYGEALQDVGVIKTEDAIQKSQLLAAQTQAVNLQFQAWKNQLVSGFMPAIVGVANAFFGTSKNGLELQRVGEGIGAVLKSVAKVALGVSAAFTIAGKLIGGVAAAIAALKGEKVATLNLMFDDISSTLADYGARIDSLNTTNGSAAKSSNTLVNAILEVNNASLASANGIKTNTKQAEEAAKAAEKQAKAQAKANKELQVNAKVKANAVKYGFGSIEQQYNLPTGLLSAINMQESRGNGAAIGPATKYGTAKGGFQFLDGTAKRFGLIGNAVFDTGKSAEAAAKYFQFLYQKFGTWEKAISAYHAGEGNVERGTGIGPINRKYVKNVMEYMGSANSSIGVEASDAIAYADEILKAQQSVVLRYLDDRQKLEIEHGEAIKQIQLAFAGDESAIKKYTDLQTATYEKDVAEYQAAQKQKRIEDAKILIDVKRHYMSAADYAREYYALVREEILNSTEYSPEVKTALVNRSYSEEGEGRDQALQDYYSATGVDTSLEDALQSRNEAIQNALDWGVVTQEQYQQDMLSSEREYFRARAAIQTQYGMSYIQGTAGVLAQVLGENSKAYQAMFAMQKAMAIAQVMMNAPTTFSNVYSSVSQIPYVGWVMAPIAAGAALALQMAQAATIGSVSFNPVGMAHNGIDNIPKEGTWLLDGGERVLNPQQNKDLTRYLSDANSQGVSTNSETHHHYSYSIQALDGKSVERVLKKHNRHVAGSMKDYARSFGR